MPASGHHWTDSPTKVIGLFTAVLALLTGLITFATQLGAFGNARVPFLPGAAKDPSISLSVGQGPSNTEVTITGHDFASEEQVTLRFHADELGTAQADDAGNFSQVVRVPGSYDAFAPRNFTIRASGNSRGKTATAEFKLHEGGQGGDSTGPATISLSTGQGPSGTQVTVTGDNFSGGEEVTIRFDVPIVGTALADANGHFTTTITIPGDYDAFGDSQHSIIAVGKTSVKNVSRPFQLTVE
jgi:hypothetical protein